MKFAIGHVRVSTNKQYEQGDSIQDQIERIEAAAKHRGYEVIRWFEEHYSGRKNQRMVIDDMLTYLDENRGDVQAVFINQISRFTRAGGDNYLYLRKKLYDLGAELIDAYGVIQETQNTLAHLGFSYTWSNRPPSRMAEVIMAEQAHAEATDILTRTVGQSIRLEQGGYQVRGANIGYKNAKVSDADGKKRPILVPHETEALWIRTMFKLRAQGHLSDQEICQRVNAMGFKTRRITRRDPVTRQVIGHRGEKPLTPKLMDRYLVNLIYCGIRKGKWTHEEAVATPFPGLVSIDEFNAANRGKVLVSKATDGTFIIERNVRVYRSQNGKQDFRLRHGVLCPICDQPFMASYSTNRNKQKFGYYHCERGHRRYSVSKAEFESKLGYLIENLTLKPSFLAILKVAVLRVWKEKNGQAKIEVKAATSHADNMRARQDLLIQKLSQVESPIVFKRLEQEIETLETEIKHAKKHKAKFDVSEDQIMQYFAIAKMALEHPAEALRNTVEKRRLEKFWSLIFAQYPTWEDIKSGTPPLTLIYRLNDSFDGDVSNVVGQVRQSWNTFEADVKRALEHYVSELSEV